MESLFSFCTVMKKKDKSKMPIPERFKDLLRCVGDQHIGYLYPLIQEQNYCNRMFILIAGSFLSSAMKA
jgi:hypothetical protein